MCWQTEGTFATARHCCDVSTILAPATKLQTYLLVLTYKPSKLTQTAFLILTQQPETNNVGMSTYSLTQMTKVEYKKQDTHHTRSSIVGSICTICCWSSGLPANNGLLAIIWQTKQKSPHHNGFLVSDNYTGYKRPETASQTNMTLILWLNGNLFSIEDRRDKLSTDFFHKIFIRQAVSIISPPIKDITAKYIN